MGLGLDMLGAGDGLRNQFLTIKVDHVDGPILKRRLAEAGQSGAIAPAVLFAVDTAPKAAVDVAIPLAEKELAKYGVTARIVASDVPPAQGGRRRSEFFPGVAVGAGVAAVVFGIGWTTWKLLLKRIFT